MADGIQHTGKLLIIFGAIAAAVGGLLLLSGKLPWIGKLPGDILIQKKNYAFYFPVVTCLVISLIITFILFLFGKR